MKAASPEGARGSELSRFTDEHLHLALEAAGVGLWFWDLKKNELIWNDQCRAVFGIPAGSPMSYEIFLAALHPEDRARTDEAIKAAIRDCGPYLIEYRSLWPDGSIHWLVARGRVLCDEARAPVSMMGVAGDISERKRIEEELRRNEEKLSMSIEAAHMGTWEWSADGHAVSLSALSAEVFGLKPGEIFRTSEEGFNLVHPDDRARQQALFERAAGSGEDFATEYRIIRPRDGQLAWVAERGRASRDPINGAIRLRGVHWDITARKLAEERLRESDQRWRRLMDSNIIGVVIADAEKILEANQAYLDILELTRDQFSRNGIAWRTLTPPEHLLADDRAAQQLLADGSCEPFEKEYYRNDGSRVPVLIGSVLLNSASFKCLSLVLDLSERKRAEARLRERDHQLRALTDAAPAYLYRVLPSLKLEFITPYFYEFTGQPIAPVSVLKNDEGDLQLEPLLHPDELEVVRSLWRDAAANLTPLSFEFRLRRTDGVYRWFMASANPELDSTGALRGFYGVAIEIHARKEAELALRERDRQLRALTDTAPVYLYKLLPNLKVEYITPFFLNFTGLRTISRDGGKLVTLNDVVHPDDVEPIRRAWRDAIAGRGDFSLEFRLRRFDGVYRWFVTRAQPEFDESGKLLGLYGAALEIHDQKEAQAALREADHRKDEFLAMLAHELRNPLTPIANAVELLKIARPDDSELTRVGEMIGRQTTILTRIVDDLLDVSRITTGKITLQKSPVDLGQVAQDAAEAVRPLVASRWQALEVIASPNTIMIVGDSMRLTQVIINLLNNAAKYSPENATIRLTIERENDDAIIRVRDNGYGISAELLPHVFDLFTQAERTPDRSQGGLGIGLTVVRKLVESHGGRVEARSDGAGKGSEFICHLPLIALPTKAQHNAAKSRDATPVKIKVLVVDDNPDCADSMAELLQLRGFDTDIARDGGSAVERFRRYRPDVVLLDIGLPDMDGHAVARRIRELPEGAHATLIAVTGYGQAKDRANSKASGFDQHMVKPVDFAKLLGMIKAVRRQAAEVLNPM